MMGCASELADTSCVVELPAALVFNVMLEGNPVFSIGKYRYSMGSINEGGPLCSVIILAEPEALVRYSKKGAKSKKFSIIVERNWLESRAKTQEEGDKLRQLFAQHGAFRHWQPSSTIINLAKELFNVGGQTSYSQRLIKESLTIQLLSVCLDEMEQSSQLSIPVNSHVSCQFSRDNELRDHVDEMLKQSASLEQIADSLSCSVSTLQRRFKANYGITVIHYCRHRRLDMAKRALALDGVSIGEAAYIAGYTYPSNFVSAFKKRFSLTPTELVRMRQLK